MDDTNPRAPIPQGMTSLEPTATIELAAEWPTYTSAISSKQMLPLAQIARSMPRPTRVFAAISALAIAANLFLLSAFIAASVAEPHPLAWIGGLIFCPLIVFMAAQQYLGTFRRVHTAATATGVLFYICGGFLFFGFVVTISEAIVEGVSLHLLAPIAIPIFLGAAFSIAFGRMNARWARKLRAAIEAGAMPITHRSFSLRGLLLAIAVIASMAGIISQFIRSAPPRHAEKLDASQAPIALPAGATDISYAKGFRGTIAYEFTIDEFGFCDWVESGIGSIESQSAGIPLREITSGFTITRFSLYWSESNGPDRITIDSGLYYSWSKEDRGVYAAYDRTTGRAYYHAHFH